jgi:lysosomal Pro-X carboxypeptidase
VTEHKGILLTMEHRFYGDSIPFGSAEEAFSHATDRIGLLSVEQAMADYANLISAVKAEHCPRCSVVAGGGSYSGKLAAVRLESLTSIAH